jgi:hypothetical protein
LIFDGFSWISLSLICLRLHLANTATALLHISRRAELFRDYVPSINASSKLSTSGCSYILELENHLTIWKTSGSNNYLEIYSISVASLIITGNNFAYNFANAAMSSLSFFVF